MVRQLALVAGGVLALASAANASIAFSFADPVPGRQVSNLQNGSGAGLGLLTYDTSAPIVFLVDDSDVGGSGATSFNNARLEVNLTLGAAITMGGVTLAPVSGDFTIYDFTGNVRTDILRGQSMSGAFVRVTGTNAIQFSTADGFSYTAGPALQAFLGALRTLVADQEAVFTLTDIATVGGGSFIGPGGVFRSFNANASFSGTSNVEVVPTPGAAALAGLAGLVALRRRR
ncbi:MAG: MYXO-CTERM sorting domain-containing protein [Phycisphaerales bacterium]